MENNKIIITIDGPDCTGKTTLWREAIETNKNIQIRGIVSNIAYALKYNRSINELIELYNRNPVNYVVYLLNPINSKKLEMVYNRIRNKYINNDDKIVEVFRDMADTWKDYQYFDEALEILRNRYKGKITLNITNDNDFNKFNAYIEQFNGNIAEIATDIDANNPAIKILDCPIEDFEIEAKRVSEYKYIVLLNKLDKDEIIAKLVDKLDDTHQKMYQMLLEYTSYSPSDIYDEIVDYCSEGKLIDSLIEYLDDYTFNVEVEASVSLDTYATVDVKLSDVVHYDCFEECIYDDCCTMDDIYESLSDELRDSEVDIRVDEIK